MFRLAFRTPPGFEQSCRLSLDRELFSRPIWDLAEANRATSLFVLWNFVLILATFLHIVAVASLDPVGAVDFLSHRTLLCQCINNTGVIGGEGWSLKNNR